MAVVNLSSWDPERRQKRKESTSPLLFGIVWGRGESLVQSALSLCPKPVLFHPRMKSHTLTGKIDREKSVIKQETSGYS